MKNKLFFLIIFILLPCLLAGCSISLDFSGGQKNAGGVFKSYDFGEKWEINNKTVKGSKIKTLNNLNATVVKIDPSNHKNIYLGTRESGLWHSADAGLSWRNILASGRIYDLALESGESGVVYASTGQRIYKTIDLGKNWNEIYLEARARVLINVLAADPTRKLNAYFGTTNGEVYKTQDGGESWQLIFKVPAGSGHEDIKKILVNPKNNKIIYLGTAWSGIFKTSDAGKTWQNLLLKYKTEPKNREFRNMDYFNDLVFDPSKNDALIFASNYGLLKSMDGGETWQSIKLLTPPGSVVIRTLTINPQNTKQIYYGTNKALFRTFDGGKTWLTSTLPSSRAATSLTIDSQTPNVVYLGMATVESAY